MKLRLDLKSSSRLTWIVVRDSLEETKNSRSRASLLTISRRGIEVLRHRGRADRVRVGERVAPRHSHAHRRPERLVRLRDVADGVERLGLRDLAVEHRRDMALRGERAADDTVFRRRLGDELVRYDVDNLTDYGVYCLRCFRVGVFHIRVGYTESARKATLNRILQVTNGMLVIYI